jgi:hypothetical protein
LPELPIGPFFFGPFRVEINLGRRLLAAFELAITSDARPQQKFGSFGFERLEDAPAPEIINVLLG